MKRKWIIIAAAIAVAVVAVVLIVCLCGRNESHALPAEEAAVVLHASTEGLPELQSLTVHVADDAALRGVIAAANETVALRSFAEQIPSMNDIFIRAVDGSL